MILANHFNSIYIGILYSNVHAKSYPHRSAMPGVGGGLMDLGYDRLC